MLLNCKQCDKNVNGWFLHYIDYVLSLQFQDGVNDLNVSAHESIFFSFV